MARFSIISKDGNTTRYEGKPRYNGSYLRPSYLEFSEIASPAPITWEVGDYVDYPRTGMRYYLYSIPQPSKNARRNAHGRSFTYSNVQLHAATKELEIALFRDLVDNDNNIHFSTSPDVATFEDVAGIARRIQACLDDFYPNRWEIRMADFDATADADVIERINTPKDFALSGGTCLDALSKIYELWDEVGWIHTHENGKEVITIGYANRRIDENTTDAFLYGKGNGLTAIKKNQTNKDEFATRLYVYGSERNLPSRYYNGKDILNAESVDIRNLMLPLDKWGKTDGLPDARKAYLENAEAVAKYGVIPKTHYFDSDEAGADIHPSIEGMTVGQIRKVLADLNITDYVPDAGIYPDDSERVDEIWAAPRVMDDGVLKRNGKEHDIEMGWYIFATTTPGTTILKGTAEKTAVVENHLIKDLDIDSQGIIRAKITFTSDKICTIEDADYESVSGVLTLANNLDSPSIKNEVGFTFVLNEDGVWEGRLPKVIANYDKQSYVRYVAFATMSVYVTPKKALASDVTASVNISDGYVTFIADQLFDKTFQLTLKQIGFDINERAAMGEGKVISMKTGMCAGRNFVISECRYVESVDKWSLVCRRQQDDTLGMLFPNKDYQISTDDRFVLTDIAMPEQYIRVAMERLFAEGDKLLARASRVQNHYEPMIDAKVMIESGRTLREGMFMEISDEDVIDNGTDYILIDTLSIYEDESAIPTYRVTLRERRKVTYKGTPSATATTSTKSVDDESSAENGGNVDIDLSGYATKSYVGNEVEAVKTDIKANPSSYVPLKTINGLSLFGSGNINVEGGGGGGSAPDEEDITTNEEGKLQFKNRDAINGMGYVILRKNVSLAEQMTKENTIYEVRYTHVLEEDLTIPANSVLRFEGGVILGSKTIVGNNTAIEASPCQILGEDLVLAGTWRVQESLPEWFGAKPVKGYLNNDLLYADELGRLDAADDSSKAINQALILSSLSGAVTVLNGGAYRTNRTIVIPSNVTLNLPTSSAIVPYMEGTGMMDEQKVYALAFDKFIPTSSMAVAVQMSSYSCRVVGHGTIALAKSRYTIGLHFLGQGWLPLDMAFSSSVDVIISGKTFRGGHYYSADTDTIIGEGEPSANEIAGAEGSTYLDTLTMVKHLWKNGGWSQAQRADHGYNTCFRVEIKGNDFRAINTRFSVWAIHCFRGIEVVTGEGGGWYNSAIWDGTISNMISSFLSIFRGPWIHDFEKINYQIDVNMCKDSKIVYCNIASFCKFGYTWDLAQVPAIAAIPRYYFGKGSSNNLLWLWSKADLYEDNGNNNVIVPKERWVQAFALPKDDAKPVIIGQDYYNALKYRTPWTTFLSNWGKMYNGVIKSSQPLAEADAMAAISSYDYTDITNGTIPAVFFDEDMATSEEVLNDATQVYAFNLSSQTQMFRMSPCEEMYVEIDYAIYDSAGELISGQTQEAKIGMLVDAGEDTSVIPLTNNTFKGSGLAYTPKISKAIITIPEGAVFYYSGIRVGVFFMEQTTGVKVVIYNVKLWKKTYNAGQIMGVERGATSERPTAAPAGYIYYDTEIGKAIMNIGTSSAIDWKDLAAGGEGGGGSEDNEFITFASPSVAAKCSELYGNNDGKLSYAQAEAVTAIADGAFRTTAVEGDFLEFVYFKNVETIGAHGFRTSKLTSIRIPASVTSLGWGAFYQCGSLLKVIIDATTPPTLGGSAFASGNANRKIYVPDSAIDAYKTAWSDYADAIVGQSEL